MWFLWFHKLCGLFKKFRWRELFLALPARPMGAGAPPRVVARVGVAVDVCEVGRRRAVPVLSNQTCASTQWAGPHHFLRHESSRVAPCQEASPRKRTAQGTSKPRVGRPCRRRSAKSLKTPYRRRRASTCPRLRCLKVVYHLHLLRQEVQGPEPHALMRGISSPLREGGL